MNTGNAKKATKKEATEREFIKCSSLDVENVRVVEGQKGDIVFFTLIINGVKIYNMRIATGRNGDFISFPQTKGKNDAYYNVVYAPLSEKDSEDVIKLVQKTIDNM